MSDEPISDRVNVYHTRVRAHQTDVNGAMYHGAFFDIFDDARIDTFRRVGYDYKRMVTTTFKPVIRHIECDFHAPAMMDDMLSITVRVERVTIARLGLRYECRRDKELLAVAHVVFAFVDAAGKPGRMPVDLRHVVEETRKAWSAR